MSLSQAARIVSKLLASNRQKDINAGRKIQVQAATMYLAPTVLIGPTPGLVRLVHLPTGKQWGVQGQERPQLAASVANEQRPMGGEVQRQWPVHAIKNQQTVPTPEGCLVLGCLGAGPLPPPGTLHLAPGTGSSSSSGTTERERESEGPPLHSFLPRPRLALPDNPSQSQHHHHRRRRYPNLTFSISLRATGPPSWTSLLSFVYCPSSLSRPDPTTTSSNLQNA